MNLCKLWRMYVFLCDVNLCNELLIESSVAAVVVCWCRVILVNAVDLHVLERYLTCLVLLHELLVKRNRRCSGCETELENAVAAVD